MLPRAVLPTTLDQASKALIKLCLVPLLVFLIPQLLADHGAGLVHSKWVMLSELHAFFALVSIFIEQKEYEAAAVHWLGGLLNFLLICQSHWPGSGGCAVTLCWAAALTSCSSVVYVLRLSGILSKLRKAGQGIWDAWKDALTAMEAIVLLQLLREGFGGEHAMAALALLAAYAVLVALRVRDPAAQHEDWRTRLRGDAPAWGATFLFISQPLAALAGGGLLASPPLLHGHADMSLLALATFTGMQLPRAFHNRDTMWFPDVLLCTLWVTVQVLACHVLPQQLSPVQALAVLAAIALSYGVALRCVRVIQGVMLRDVDVLTVPAATAAAAAPGVRGDQGVQQQALPGQQLQYQPLQHWPGQESVQAVHWLQPQRQS